jgi:hypothetical protein
VTLHQGVNDSKMFSAEKLEAKLTILTQNSAIYAKNSAFFCRKIGQNLPN